MNDLLSLLEDLPINNRTVLIFAAVIVAVTFVLFLVIRFAWSLRHVPSVPGPEDDVETGILAQPAVVRHRGRKAGAGRGKPGWAARMDGAFDEMVHRSGLELAPDQALGWLALTAVSSAIGLFLWKPEWWMALAGLVGGGGAVLAIYVFFQARYRRLLQDELPDAIFMLARSARAGLSLERAIELAGVQAGQRLAAEFRRCSGQIELGLPVVSALQNTARRVRLLDFNALVSTVALYQGSGGNLPLLLDRLASSTRDHNQFRSYLRSATAMGRITALTIGTATPLILVGYLVMQPEFSTNFFHSREGWITISAAFGVELIGAAWLHRLLTFEY